MASRRSAIALFFCAVLLSPTVASEICLPQPTSISKASKVWSKVGKAFGNAAGVFGIGMQLYSAIQGDPKQKQVKALAEAQVGMGESIRAVGDYAREGFEMAVEGVDRNAKLIVAANEAVKTQLTDGFHQVANSFARQREHVTNMGNEILFHTKAGIDIMNGNVLANGAKIEHMGEYLGAKMDSQHAETMHGLGGLALQAERNTAFLAGHWSSGVSHLSSKLDDTNSLVVQVGGQLSQQMDQNHGQVMSGISTAIQEGRAQTSHLASVMNAGINSVNQNIGQTQKLIVDVGSQLSGQLSQQHHETLNTLGTIYDQNNQNTAMLSGQLTQGFNSVHHNLAQTQRLVAGVGHHLSDKIDRNRELFITGVKGLSEQGIRQTQFLSDQMNNGFNGAFQGLEANFKLTQVVGETLLREMKADTQAIQNLLRSNAKLTLKVGEHLASKTSAVQSDLTDKISTVWQGIVINNDAIESFKGQVFYAFDEIVSAVGLLRKDVQLFRNDLGKALDESFNMVQKQLIAHYEVHTNEIEDVRNDLSERLRTVFSATAELADLTVTGFYREEQLANVNAALLEQMEAHVLDAFSTKIQISLANQARLIAVENSIQAISNEMTNGFERLEKLIKSEFASIKQFDDEIDLRNIIIPLNATMQTMLQYMEIRTPILRLRFIEQFEAADVPTLKDLILGSYKKRLRNHVEFLVAQGKFNYRLYEELRDVLVQGYETAQILSAFYNYQISSNKVDLIKSLYADIHSYQAGMTLMADVDAELREDVAFEEFKQFAARYFVNSVADVDTDADDVDIHRLLRSIHKKLSSRVWNDDGEPVNNYMLFSTKKCPTQLSRIHRSTKHLFTHKNQYGMQFFLYRQNLEPEFEDSLTIQETALDELSNLEPASSRNASHTAVTRMCSCAEYDCEPMCNIVVTTGDCFITDGLTHNFGAIIGTHKNLRIFLGM